MQEPLWVWVLFNAVVLLLILADLFVFHRSQKVISIKNALVMSGFWFLLALFFNYGVYVYKGEEAALKFFAGYLIEKSLSVDNLFVFLLLFKSFKTPDKYHHKVLFFGILGAILMRALFIFFGIALVNLFHWVLYLFGLFLIYAGVKMALPKDEEIHLENNLVLKLANKLFYVTSDYDNDHFFVRREGKWLATPLFILLLAIESTDLVFALDSIPAVMAITRDPFIIYTSNILAVMGLRSLYFALSAMMPLFHYLHYGLAAVLVFVGFKMLIAPLLHISIGVSLAFIAVCLGGAVCLSLLYPDKPEKTL